MKMKMALGAAALAITAGAAWAETVAFWAFNVPIGELPPNGQAIVPPIVTDAPSGTAGSFRTGLIVSGVGNAGDARHFLGTDVDDSDRGLGAGVGVAMQYGSFGTNRQNYFHFTFDATGAPALMNLTFAVRSTAMGPTAVEAFAAGTNAALFTGSPVATIPLTRGADWEMTAAIELPAVLAGDPSSFLAIRPVWGSDDHTQFERVEIDNVAIEDATPSCPADLDGDGQVGSSDLASLLGSWGANPGPADLDGDGQVGSSDLASLLGSWGACS